MNAEFSLILKRLILLFSGLLILAACATTNKDEKFYARQDAREVRQQEQDYQKKLKLHKQMQSRETLKMMKQTEREARKLNKHKKR